MKVYEVDAALVKAGHQLAQGDVQAVLEKSEKLMGQVRISVASRDRCDTRCGGHLGLDGADEQRRVVRLTSMCVCGCDVSACG